MRAHLETLVEKTVPLQRCERELLVKDGGEMLKKARAVEQIYRVDPRDDELVTGAPRGQERMMLEFDSFAGRGFLGLL